MDEKKLAAEVLALEFIPVILDKECSLVTNVSVDVISLKIIISYVWPCNHRCSFILFVTICKTISSKLTEYFWHIYRQMNTAFNGLSTTLE